MALMIDKNSMQKREKQTEEKVVEARGVDNITQFVRPLDESTIAMIQINPIGSELEMYVIGRGRYDNASKSFKTTTVEMFTRKRLIALRDFLNAANLEDIFRVWWMSHEEEATTQQRINGLGTQMASLIKTLNFNLSLSKEEGEKPGESSLSPEEKKK